MSDRIDTLESPTSLTRREFTLEAVMAILAGCIITVSDVACGGSTTKPSPTDVTGTISDNHGHTATISAVQITSGAATAVNIQGNASHPHTVSVSAANLSTLAARQAVTIDSTTDVGHMHRVTFTPA